MAKPCLTVSILALALGFCSSLSAQTKRAAKSKASPASTVQPASGESADHQPIPIESLKIDGNHNYTPDQILAVAGLKIGQRVMKNDFEGARDRLVATGAFDNVGYRYAPAADAKGYDVLFQVTEMEHLYPLRFDDLPASDAQLRAWLKDNDPLFDGKTGAKIPGTKPELDRYVKLISEFLARQEYHEPVIGKLVSIAPSELVIVFRPAAPPPSVAYVKFNNTGDISAATLQKQIYSVAVGTVYTEQQFRTLLDSSIRPLYDAIGRIRVSFPK